MKANRIKIYQILAIIMIVVLSAVILFMPNLIEQKYPWTYQNIQDKKNELVSVSETLSGNEREIQHLKQNLQDLKKREKKAAEDVSQLKKGMKDADFQRDIPSFLITLEQKAYETGVDLLIGYNSLITTKGSSSHQDPTAESSTEGGVDDDKSGQGTPQENKTSDKTTEGIEVNESTTKENKASDKTTKETEANESTTGDPEKTTKETEVNGSTTKAEDTKDGENKEEDKGPKINNNVKIPTIDSIDVTTIPIEIKGTFFKVRDYLKFLDELGLVEPSSIKMTTDGLEVTAEITLNIFHGEGGVNIE